MCTCEFMCLPMCVYCVSHARTCTHAHAYRHAHTHANTCTRMYTCTHTHVSHVHTHLTFLMTTHTRAQKDTMIWDIKTVLRFGTIV